MNDQIEEEFLFILCRNCGTELQQHKLGRNRKCCGVECKREWEKTKRNFILWAKIVLGSFVMGGVYIYLIRI